MCYYWGFFLIEDGKKDGCIQVRNDSMYYTSYIHPSPLNFQTAIHIFSATLSQIHVKLNTPPFWEIFLEEILA